MSFLENEIEQRRLELLPWLDAMIQKPRFGAFPAPDMIERNKFCDSTKTINDFILVRDWAKSIGLMNVSFYTDIHEQGLTSSRFRAIVPFSVNALQDAVRNTHKLDATEIVFFYYAGHGLERAAVTGSLETVSADPKFAQSNVAFFDSIAGVVETLGTRDSRVVRGGEMCLLDCGFCDLNGLMRPWIASLLSPSERANGTKTNKHFIAVLDSCYSGAFVNDVCELGDGPWARNSCSITVQSSTTHDRVALAKCLRQCLSLFRIEIGVRI